MKLVMALVIVLHGLPALAQQTQALRGRVVAEESFAPLAGARILIGMRQVGRTDDRGQFQVMVPKGLSQLRAEKSGFVTRTFEARGASTEVRMTRGANLTVRAVDETGQPVPLRRIRVAGPIGVATRTVDEFGKDRLTGLPAGRYSAEIQEYPAPGGSDAGDRAEQARRASDARQKTLDRSDRGLRLRPGEDGVLTVVDAWKPSKAAGRDARAGAIRGRVTDPDGRPVPNARVRLLAPLDMQTTVSDAAGVYSFENVSPGKFRLYASAAALLPAAFGAEFAGTVGKDIAVGPGQRLDDIDVALRRGGAISGSLRDEYGEPYEHVNVELHAWEAGQGLQGRTQPRFVGASSTDETGQFRIAGVPEGDYYVIARPQPGRIDGPVFYRGALQFSDATAVHIATGAEVTGIGLVLDSTRGAHLSGQVTNAAGAVFAGGAIRLTGRDGSPFPVVARETQIGSDGGFEFINVPPGDYGLSVGSPFPFSAITINGLLSDPLQFRLPPSEAGGTSIVVTDANPLRVTIRTSTRSSVSGLAVFETRPSGISPSDFVLSAARGEGKSAIRDDWTFSLEDLSAPTRLTLTSAPPGWWLKQLMVNGVNAAEVPVEFGTAARSRHGVTAVLASTAARISGLVLGEGATGVGGSPVVVFPVDPSRWAERSLHVQRTRADQAGRYFVNVPPGEYWVAASDATPDTGVFEKLVTNAARVTAGEGADIVRDIRIAPPLAK